MLPMENGHCASPHGLPKYKRQRASAVRDFPPGCGRFVLQTPNRDTVVGRVCPEADNLVHSSNHLERPELVSVDPEGALFPESENLKPLECKISSGSKHLNGADICASKKEMSLESGLKALLPPNRRIAVPSISEENSVTKIYPPRRRVSAIRDFPPICGPNAPCIGKEELCKVIVSLKSLDEENFVTEERSLRGTVETDVKQMEEYGDVSRIICDQDLSNLTEHATMGVKKHDEFGTSSKSIVKVAEEDAGKNIITSPRGTEQYRFDHKVGSKSSNKDVGVSEENPVRDIVVHAEDKQFDRNCSDFLGSGNQFTEEDPDYSLVASNLVIVHGLMASQNCPWRQGEGAFKCNRAVVTSESVVTGESKSKKHDMLLVCESAFTRKNEAESSRGPLNKKNLSSVGEADQAMVPLVVWDEEDSLVNDGENKKFQVDHRSLTFDVNLLPSMRKGAYNDVTGALHKVRETLCLFQGVCRKLLQEEEAKVNGQNSGKRIDYLAARILKNKGKYINDINKIIGSVPGVEVGDEFHYRIKLNIIGLHHPTQGGIDYVKHKGKFLAASIVASGGYDDDLDNSDVLTYTGQEGNEINGGKEPEDQKLERRNQISEGSSVKRKLDFTTEALELETEVFDRGFRVQGRYVGPSTYNSCRTERTNQGVRALSVSISGQPGENAGKEPDLGKNHRNITPLDVLKMLAAKSDCDSSLENRSILDVAKSRGMTFP
ncbi:hypothetical protein Patl1_32959 [Pistacia atlantica]|uniref:Uncharacterized protein n=1 Tax=Pistacia atlantica TaxID=434234 RepID=A0ACC1AS38_9ROSI|nr:hypothetical protein Patl1_32959 [Pistacia atlantica]